MVTEKFSMEVMAVGTDDYKRTYEIHRKLRDGGKKSLVISLYPTISADKCDKLDLSTMHLLNHCNELGWGEVKILNLYSTVFKEKPLVSQLQEDGSNLAYIEEILEMEDIKNYEIVIAWGNSLASHKQTINLKIDLLTMLIDKGLESNVKCITTENLNTLLEHGIHPLYLGLHYGRDKWELQSFPAKNALNELKKAIQPTAITQEVKTKKGGKKNVPKNKE